MNFPIITVTIDHLRQEVQHAFGKLQLNLDEQFQKALEDALHPERVTAIIQNAALNHTKEAIQHAVRAYFLETGPGHQVIVAEVKRMLDARFKPTA